MEKKTFLLAGLIISFILSLFLTGYTIDKDTTPPEVILVNPANGSVNIDPSITEISVTFNETMMDKSWSWCYEDKNKFPEITGSPYFNEKCTKCILPVKLEPNKEYVIWINTAKNKSFKDKAKNPLPPYKWTFKTK